jgi:hypothetical protein
MRMGDENWKRELEKMGKENGNRLEGRSGSRG